MDQEEKEDQEKMQSAQSFDIPDLVEAKCDEELGDSTGISNHIHKSTCTEVYIVYTGTNVSQTEVSVSEAFIYDSKHWTKATHNINGA